MIARKIWYALLFDYTLSQCCTKSMPSDLQSVSITDSLVPDVLPHDILVCRRWHTSVDRRRYSMPGQQFRIRSDAASGAAVRRRRVRHGETLVVHLTHLRSMDSIRIGWPKVMTLHRYGRGRNIVSRRMCGRGSDRRSVLMATMMSTPWCRFDPDNSLLVVVPSAETA
jgi:hypothetical protein